MYAFDYYRLPISIYCFTIIIICIIFTTTLQIESAMGRVRDELLDLPVAEYCEIDSWGRIADANGDYSGDGKFPHPALQQQQ